MPYTQTNLAYVAGILDADGFIGLTRPKRRNGKYYYQPRIRVGQDEMNAIDLLEKMFGGATHEIEDKREKPKRRNRFDWQLTGIRLVAKALESLLPYLRIKYPQAVNILEFCKLRTKAKYGRFGSKEDKFYEWHNFFIHGGKIPDACEV